MTNLGVSRRSALHSVSRGMIIAAVFLISGACSKPAYGAPSADGEIDEGAKIRPALQQVWCQKDGQLSPPPDFRHEGIWPAGYYLCCILTFPTMSLGESFRPGVDKIPEFSVDQCAFIHVGEDPLNPMPPDLGDFDPNGIIAAVPTAQVDEPGAGPVQEF
jgi:hypothetical protein